MRLGENKDYIIKTTRIDDPAHQANLALVNEYEILKELSIAGIRKPVRLESTQDGPALFLEYIDGLPLGAAIEESTMAFAEMVATFAQLCGVLEEVHQRGIIHKDLNPSNVLLEAVTGKVYIIDFGIASKHNLKVEHLGNPNKLEGTLSYISPEQTGRMDRVIDSRSDLYSLGVTMYEMFTGKLPFTGDSPLSIVHKQITQAAVSPETLPLRRGLGSGKVPVMLSQIIMKLMAKNAEDRYRSAAGVKYDLDRFLELWEKGDQTTFTLGEGDHSTTFRIPQKLYGVDNELKALTDEFEAAARGQTRIAMITGHSGVGKSALVRTLQKGLSGKNAIFISGKYDQLQRSQPYSAFIQALREMTSLLLTENDEVLEGWRNEFHEALGDSGKVITEMVPELEQILGPQPDVPELPTVESQNRREFLFRQVINKVASPEHPLIVFLDDLQWIDSASIELLNALLKDPTPKAMLFIGAYRDNELSDNSPLALVLKDLAEDYNYKEIHIANLSTTSVNALVADTLSAPGESTTDLSKLVQEKLRAMPSLQSNS